jgi:Agglutinin C-terminal
MYGQGPTSGHAYNWQLTQDLNSVSFFEPQTGETMADIGFYAYLGLF